MCIEPGRPLFHAYLQNHRQIGGIFHVPFQKFPNDVDFLGRRLNDQLIVHLQDQLRLKSPLPQLVPHADHGDLHDVRRRSLDRCVHRHTLPKGTLHEIGRRKLRHRAASSEKRQRVALFLRKRHQMIEIPLDPGIGGKILLDIISRFLARDGQILAQSEGTDPVHDPEIDQPFPYRVFGQTRYDTAMEIADEVKAMYGDDGKFKSFIVASGDAFPDALTGSYLSIKNFAPVLLITNKQDKVKNSVIDYIGANAIEGAEIFILGGTRAVDAKFEADLKAKGYEVTRLAGEGRFETNLAILGEVDDPGTDLLVCSGLSWPDAATSSATGLPILIVDKELNADQKAYLEAQNFTDIYVVGGSAVVSDDMLNSLKPYADTVTRVAGANRAETAIAVAEEFYPEYLYTLVFADYRNFPDCISGGLLANRLGAPILYGPAYLNTNKAFVEKCEAGDAYVYGGKTLVTTDFFLNAYADMLSWRFGYEQ